MSERVNYLELAKEQLRLAQDERREEAKKVALALATAAALIVIAERLKDATADGVLHVAVCK